MVKKASKKTAKKKTPFDEEKELLQIRKDSEELRHKNKMEELVYIRESDKIRHDQELERGRIKSAEIRKSMERKEMLRYGKPNRY